MSRNLTDWGLPDWLDPRAYGNTSEWSGHRWRWEFTRRRDDVREAFLKHAEDTHKALMAAQDYAEMEAKDGKTPDNPGFWAMTQDTPMFGMVGIPNPSISDQPLLEHLFSVEHGEVYPGAGKNFLDPDEWTPIFLAEGTVAISFDITRPLAPQVRSATATLKRLAAPKQRRRHRKNWLIYLRALDGREAGASWNALAKELLGRAQQERDSAPQAARELWQQARSLMFNWPD